jgi:hypothetical protein
LSILDLFVPIIPRHIRLMQRLVDQKKIDRLGCIGWRGLMDEDEVFTIDQLFKPLRERGLVEDLTKSDLGNAGVYFVHITPLGEKCLGLGYMLREPRVMSDAEQNVLGPAVNALQTPMLMTEPPDATQCIRIIERAPAVPQKAIDEANRVYEEAERRSGLPEATA